MADTASGSTRRMDVRARAEKAVATGRVIPYLAGVIAGLAVLAGLVAFLVDRKDFPTFGDGVWWAIVTLGTVGYGDIVPHTAWGRVLGGVVIVFGVTFISFLTATVTSYFLGAEQAKDAATQAQLLREISAQLSEIRVELAGLKDRA
jgi:voltage-gated potassium channel Kch